MEDQRHSLTRKARRAEVRLKSVGEIIPLDSWTVSPEYFRDLYGQDVADAYVEIREKQIAENERAERVGGTVLGAEVQIRTVKG